MICLCANKNSPGCHHGVECSQVPTSAGGGGDSQPHCRQMLFEPVISKETSHLLPGGFSVMLVSACQTEFTFLPEHTQMDLCQIQWQSLQTWVIPSAADSMEKCTYFHAGILYDATRVGMRHELLVQIFF